MDTRRSHGSGGGWRWLCAIVAASACLACASVDSSGGSGHAGTDFADEAGTPSHYDELSKRVSDTDSSVTIQLAGEDVGFYKMTWSVNDLPGDCDTNTIGIESMRFPYAGSSAALSGAIPWPQSSSIPVDADVKSFVRHDCGSWTIPDATLGVDYFSEPGLLYADTRRLHLVGTVTVEVVEQLSEPERARLRITFSKLEHDPDQPHPDWVQASDDFTDDIVIEGEFQIWHLTAGDLPPETVVVPAP